MATIVNARDLALQGQAPRVTSSGRTILLTSTGLVFQSNTGTPASVDFSATLVNIVGTVSFSTSPVVTLTGTGNTRNLTFANMTAASVVVTASVTYLGVTYNASQTIVKVADGATGATGPIGNTGATGSTGSTGAAGANAPLYGTSYLYQFSTVQPALPTGTATYTWASGVTTYTGTDAWSATVPANPGTAGIQLWVLTKPVTSPYGTVNMTVSYTGVTPQAVAANGANGAAGATGSTGSQGIPGIKAVVATAYQWGLSAPTASGAATYTWSAGTYDTPPATGWSQTKPTNTTQGFTLFEARKGLVESSGATTSAIDWSSASVVGIAYNGNNGANGAQGPAGAAGATGNQGVSARIAYTLIDGSSLAATPATVTYTGDVLPATGVWGETRAWVTSPPATAVGQAVFQSNGLFNPATNQTTWTTPYLSNLKVGNLSAIATNTGSLTVGGTISSANGNFAVDANGNVTARAISIQDSTGLVILSSGVALHANYAAAGTRNTDLTIGANGTLSGGGGGSVTITGLGYSGALNATANIMTAGTLAARPAGSNGDTYFATDTALFYQKIAGAWQVTANSYTNTNQLSDGAGLGQTAAWGNVSSRPSNISSLTGSESILNSGVTLSASGALVGAGGGTVTIGGLGYSGALNATANLMTSGTLASRPVGSNGDTYYATDTALFYQKIAGAWQVTANSYSNTNQLSDGAGLGQTANWGNVSSRPSNLASLGGTEPILNTNITMSASGVLGGAGGGTVTVAGLDDTILRYGRKISAANASNYLTAGGIDGTYIANLTAGSISAGTISADRLTISDTTNLADNASFEFGNYGWPIQEGGWGINSIGTSSWNGTWAAQLPSGRGASALRNGNLFKISLGDKFYCKARLTSYDVRSQAYIRMTLQNSSGGEISIAASSSQVNYGWVLHEFTATITQAYIDARYITARFEIVGISNFAGWTASDGCAADDCGVFRIVGTTLIQDGAITTDKIVVGSLNADRLAANTVTAAQIATNTIIARNLYIRNQDAADPDPRFYDVSFWTNGGSSYPGGISVGESAGWPVARTLVFNNVGNFNVGTKFFPIELGATFRFKITIYKDASVGGTFGFVAHFPAQSYFAMGVPTSGQAGANGIPAWNFGAIPNNQWTTYIGTFTNVGGILDGNNPNNRLQFIYQGNVTGGNLHIAIEMVRVADVNLIVDGAITANKLSIGSSSNVLPTFRNANGWTRGYASAGVPAYQAGYISYTAARWHPIGLEGAVFQTWPGTIADGEVCDTINYNDSRYFPVTANQRYEVSAYLSMHRCDGQLLIVFFDKDGNQLYSESGSTVLSNGQDSNVPMASFGRSTKFFTASSTAVKCYIGVRAYFHGSAPGYGDNPYCFISGYMLNPANPNQITFSPYAAGTGGTIIDGSGITSRSITTDRIQVGAVSKNTAQQSGNLFVNSGQNDNINPTQILNVSDQSTLLVMAHGQINIAANGPSPSYVYLSLRLDGVVLSGYSYGSTAEGYYSFCLIGRTDRVAPGTHTATLSGSFTAAGGGTGAYINFTTLIYEIKV